MGRFEVTELTQEELKRVLRYDPETGKFHWLAKISNKVVIGAYAGSMRADLYIHIKLNYKSYQAHRLAFLYMIGEIPKEVDHIDRMPFNNKWSNLRAATRSENCFNRGKQSNNVSGVKGVCWSKRDHRWRAQIGVKGRYIHLGTFTSKESAIAARKAAELRYNVN